MMVDQFIVHTLLIYLCNCSIQHNILLQLLVNNVVAQPVCLQQLCPFIMSDHLTIRIVHIKYQVRKSVNDIKFHVYSLAIQYSNYTKQYNRYTKPGLNLRIDLGLNLGD